MSDSKEKRLFIGLMSGTSMDGIDVALIDLASTTFIQGITCPYSDDIQQKLCHFLSVQTHSLQYYSELNTLLGREFAKAALLLLKTSGYSTDDIIAIGSHGQTVCHDTTSPIPYTVQLGCAHSIAEITGVTVVADFRTRDLVVGGQGAPLAPIWHQALFQSWDVPLAVVNVGGISNISYIMSATEVIGYDVGPGNCLMDAWAYQHLGVKYDNQGAWADSGTLIQSLLESMLDDTYFQRPYPKSIGKEYFSTQWLQHYLSGTEQAKDVQATLLQLTALSIATSFQALPHLPTQLLICGGGAHNHALLRALSDYLPNVAVAPTHIFSIDPDFVEACMFAWLADKALRHMPLNLTTITGSAYPTVLGAIYPSNRT